METPDATTEYEVMETPGRLESKFFFQFNYLGIFTLKLFSPSVEFSPKWNKEMNGKTKGKSVINYCARHLYLFKWHALRIKNRWQSVKTRIMAEIREQSLKMEFSLAEKWEEMFVSVWYMSLVWKFSHICFIPLGERWGHVRVWHLKNFSNASLLCSEENSRNSLSQLFESMGGAFNC